MTSHPNHTPRRNHAARGWRRPVGWIALLAIVSVTLQPVAALAQDEEQTGRHLRPGDVLDLSVPGRPDLSTELTVGIDGNVTVPQVGEVAVAGLDLATATTVLKQKIRLFVPTLDSLDLELIPEAGNPRIYIIGQVVQPGSHSFTTNPTVWDVMREAGGPTADADLRAARVIREEDGTPTVHPLDLSGILEGTAVATFQLRDGDTLIVPRLAEGVSGVPMEEGVKVIGAVQVPAVVPLEGPMHLLDVLMLAGTPVETSNLEKVLWVHEEAGRIQSTEVDLKAYLQLGQGHGNPMIYPGDTVAVAFEKPSWIRANVPFILGSLAALATIYLALDNIANNNNR